MIRWIALTVAGVLVAFGVVLAVQHKKESSVPRLVQEHKAVPSFDLTTLDGKAIGAKGLAGKTYVVNFWNSWCIPCRQEEGALRAFYKAHAKDPDFGMVGIVRDDSEGAIRRYQKSNGIAWPVAMDPNGTAGLGFGTTGQPETYVISPAGVAACGGLGPVTESDLERWLQAVRAGGVCV